MLIRLYRRIFRRYTSRRHPTGPDLIAEVRANPVYQTWIIPDTQALIADLQAELLRLAALPPDD